VQAAESKSFVDPGAGTRGKRQSDERARRAATSSGLSRWEPRSRHASRASRQHAEAGGRVSDPAIFMTQTAPQEPREKKVRPRSRLDLTCPAPARTSPATVGWAGQAGKPSPGCRPRESLITAYLPLPACPLHHFRARPRVERRATLPSTTPARCRICTRGVAEMAAIACERWRQCRTTCD